MNYLYIPVLSALVVAFSLAGCFKKEALSVAHYIQHPEERIAVLSHCKDATGSGPSEIDCRNALQASVSSWGSSTLPPVDYGSKQNAGSLSTR